MNSTTARPLPGRRQVVAALAALTAAGVVGGRAGASTASPSAAAEGPADPVRSVDPHAAEPFTSVTGDKDALLLQVLAHPDDDLYFMNPDARHVLDGGASVVSVYVTAGEARGLNFAPGRPLPAVDKPGYTASRQQGLRQAYAEMLGLHRFARWQRSVLKLPGGITAETNVLAQGGRSARLVFFNIATLSAAGHRTPDLWDTPGATMESLLPTGSPLRRISTYRHQSLVDALAHLMDRYRPTLIHTLDPDPDFQVHDATHRRDNDQPGCSDHRDHTPIALFAWKAMFQWASDATRRDGRAPRFTTTAFRGYYNQRWPHNLPADVLGDKARFLAAYGGGPDWECGNAAGCGDYSQGGTRPLRNRKGWIRSTHYRYPGARLAPVTEADGRLVAFGVLGTQLVRWQETAAGSGRWAAPDNLSGGPLAPALSAVVDRAGRQLVFALRFAALEGQGGANVRELVVLEQQHRGGAFRAWKSLGNPEGDPDRGRRVGCPAAVATPDGGVHLFARTADKSIATRVRDPHGRWSPWRRITEVGAPGAGTAASADAGEIQDGLTVTLDAKGRVHVFAAGRGTLRHWAQSRTGGPVTAQPPTGLPIPGEQPAAALDPSGALLVTYRTPAAPDPIAYSIGGGAAASKRAPTPLRAFDGYGPLATSYAPTSADTRTDPHTDADADADSRANTPGLLALGRGRDGEAILQYGTGAGARPTRSPHRLRPVGLPALVPPGPRAPAARVIGISPAATPWLWQPRPTGRA
ncbi:PIG-L family deacetylase [Streptomyces zagrosensis]|uniref:LmbE family N-acetylglucosaminyl deacetylase n=1 Tax=Streptomyces zagrosensis TaxID=1042984 RepID=A0A7W9QF95_9ACTN|nr:PIG-L family deacetylase [Streptomyces zagrosensis]MBB5938142.1 LmbE family N-acetylglucosaminyl deacetylase [Streptomyces zagrosensis]